MQLELTVAKFSLLTGGGLTGSDGCLLLGTESPRHKVQPTEGELVSLITLAGGWPRSGRLVKGGELMKGN